MAQPLKQPTPGLVPLGSETFAGSIVVETFFVFELFFIDSLFFIFKFIVVELPWKTGLCASSHKTWWSSTTCCTLSPDFPPRRLWTGLCFLSLSLSLKKQKTQAAGGD